MSGVSWRESAGRPFLQPLRSPTRRDLCLLRAVESPGQQVLQRLWRPARCPDNEREDPASLRVARHLHAKASRGSHPHIQGRARRRAQGRHGPLCRPQGIDGAPLRSRPGGGAPDPRSGAGPDDGCGASVRGHREPGDGRRDHGALRRAARPRGSRGARVLRGAPHARRDPSVHGGATPDAGRRGADPRGPELGRRGGALDRQRSPDGLHGGRPDDAPRRAHGAARVAGHDAADHEHAGIGGRLRAGAIPWTRPGQRGRGARRDLRAHRRRLGAHPAASSPRARVHAVRRSRRRDGADAPVGRAGAEGPRTADRGRR